MENFRDLAELFLGLLLRFLHSFVHGRGIHERFACFFYFLSYFYILLSTTDNWVALR